MLASYFTFSLCFFILSCIIIKIYIILLLFVCGIIFGAAFFNFFFYTPSVITFRRHIEAPPTHFITWKCSAKLLSEIIYLFHPDIKRCIGEIFLNALRITKSSEKTLISGE